MDVTRGPYEKSVILKEGEVQTFINGLRGRVFHVSAFRNLDSIRDAGAIKVNRDNSMATTFGNAENSFYRLRSCVSVFDYETPTDQQFEEHRHKCQPLSTDQNEDRIIFFLSDLARSHLQRYGDVRDIWQENVSERVVPFVEAGYPGDIPLGHIEEFVTVHIELDPNGLTAMFRKEREARRRRMHQGRLA